MTRVLSNSPQDVIQIEIEQRKSFSFGLWIQDADAKYVDITGGEFSFIVGKLNRDQTVTKVAEVAGEIQAAILGYVKFNVQAADLDLKAGSYFYTVTMIHDGYSAVIMNGGLELRPNLETTSVGEEYTGNGTAQSISAVLRQKNDVHLTIDHTLPPDLLHIPAGGVQGDVLAKSGPGPYDLVWANVNGGLSAAGIPASYSPVATGFNSWVWQQIVLPADLLNETIARIDGDNTVLSLAAQDATAKANLAQSAAATDATTKSNNARTNAVADAKTYTDSQIIVAKSYTDTREAAILGNSLVRFPSGVLMPLAGTALPSGWLLCDGTAVSRTTYAALFAAIGIGFGGGDGSTTFNLPDLRGRVIAGIDTLQTEFSSRGKTGSEQAHTLTVAEMPSHSHNFLYGGAQYGNFPYGAVGDTGGGLKFFVSRDSYSAGISIAANGGGGAHNVLQPYTALNYIIKY